MSKKATITRAWKGLDLSFQCRSFQFEIGKEYTEAGKPRICSNGFHACLHPLDVLKYYPAKTSRFAEVELIGDLGREASENADSKVCAGTIRIVREITYFDLWQAHREWLAEQTVEKTATGTRGHAAATGNDGHAAATGNDGHAAATGTRGRAAATGTRGHAAATGTRGHAAATGNDGHAAATGNDGHAAATGYAGHAAATGYAGHAAATGNDGHAAATGYAGHAAATGDAGHAAATGTRGHAAATGNDGHAAATGENAIAVALGRWSRAKAGVGGWIVLVAYNDDWSIRVVKTGKIGEGGLTADTWYRLSDDDELVVCA